jgi:Na+/phosphate symporter
MASADARSPRLRLRRALAAGLALLIVVAHALLPDGDERTSLAPSSDEPSDERERLEIIDTSPHDPYPGSSITIRYEGAEAGLRFRVFAAKKELALLAERPGELLARLPADLRPGPLKLRISQGEATLDHGEKSARSKPYLVRVKAPNLRKLFRNLLGGAALVALGIALLSRGVRQAIDLDVAHAVTRFAQRRTIVYAFGVATGGVLQSTTSSASLFAALHSSHLLPLAPAALAMLGAQLGAGLTPLLLAGLIEPREGLLLVGIGALWLMLALDRRSSALGRLLLGAGFVAFGLQLFRPALEPFVSDPVLLSLADELSAHQLPGLCARALFGALLTAALQGPAGLIVLILGFAETTSRFDLLEALSLLAGTSFGSALAAALTASGGKEARALARLNLGLGLISSALAVASLPLWVRIGDLILTPEAVHGGRSSLSERTLALLVGFGGSELLRAVFLSICLPTLARWLARAPRALSAERDHERAHSGVLRTPPGDAVERALCLHLRALEALHVLAQSGARGFGQRAEHSLKQARALIDFAITRELADAKERPLKLGSEGTFDAPIVASAQLQNALESLLDCAERITEARLLLAVHDPRDLTARAQRALIDELHTLISEGLEVTRESVLYGRPPDLERARAREIHINRLEARARRELRRHARPLSEQLQLLRLVDAYESVGNHVYRLLESLSQSEPMQAA